MQSSWHVLDPEAMYWAPRQMQSIWNATSIFIRAGPSTSPTHEARQRLEHERNSRLAQLRAIEEGAPHADESLQAAQTAAIRRVLEEIDAAGRRLTDGSYGTHSAEVRSWPAAAHCVRPSPTASPNDVAPRSNQRPHLRPSPYAAPAEPCSPPTATRGRRA
jgi:hypothetical protein